APIRAGTPFPRSHRSPEVPGIAASRPHAQTPGEEAGTPPPSWVQCIAEAAQAERKARKQTSRYILSPDAGSRGIMSPVTARWLLLFLGPLLLRPAAATTVWVADPLTRVRPKDAPRSAAEATLKAARNEAEAFQIVVRAG